MTGRRLTVASREVRQTGLLSLRPPKEVEGLAATAAIHPGLAEQFVAHGLIEPIQSVGPEFFLMPPLSPDCR